MPRMHSLRGPSQIKPCVSPYLQGKVIEVKPGDYGGNVTVNQLEVNVTADHHGAVYICEAENAQLKRSVHNAITLSVNCEYIRNST